MAPRRLFFMSTLAKYLAYLKNILTDDHLVQTLFTHALLNLTKHPLSCIPGPRL